MPNEPNGTGRLDRLEALLDKMGDRLDKVATMGYLHDERLARIEANAEQIQGDVKQLVGAIRDLIDRIPPENLRNPV